MDYKPHLIKWSDVEAEARTGKQFITTHMDNAGHPVLVLRPRYAAAIAFYCSANTCIELSHDLVEAKDYIKNPRLKSLTILHQSWSSYR